MTVQIRANAHSKFDDANTFSVRQPMYANLGTVLPDYISAEDACQMVTPWEAIARKAFTEDGMPMETQAIVRSDNGFILGEVGPDYEVFTNRQTWGFFTEVLNAAELKIEVAGTLYGGKRVWVMARAAEFEVTGDRDNIREYVYLYNSHDGSRKIVGGTLDHRIFCSNQLRSALKQGAFAVKHTRNAAVYVADGAELMGFAVKQAEKNAEMYRALANVNPTEEEVTAVLEQLFPEPEDAKRDTWSSGRAAVSNLYENAETCNLPGMVGTAWSLYNAAAEYSDFLRKPNWTEERSWLSATEGIGAEFKDQALNLCLTLV